MAALLVFSSVSCAEDDSVVNRLNYGEVFQHSSQVVIARDYWLHTFEIVIPDKFDVPALPACKVNNQSCLMLSHMMTQINSLRLGTAAKFNDTISSIESLIPESTITQSRSKRALLPFIGKLSKGLFGTATMDDVNILADHMNELTKMSVGLSEALSQHEDHVSSFISTANKRMDNLMSGIQKNMLAIKFIQSELQGTSYNMHQVIDYVTSILIDQIKDTSSIHYELEEFKLGVLDLINGKLSPLLITESVLHKTIADIQILLHDKYPGLFLAIFNTKDIYLMNDFLFARNGSSLFVTLKTSDFILKRSIAFISG
ncbi:hypothetical protein DPMN_137430 [Dreissena polymorpha]|uniref:Uncharacterized protein n=1 Tax=Dreissena polymorpha TaxID=45954 RepID=A0A9D4G2R3_DREPO|nr:hypothetical protein DPMN_137430 [Dreissena polymorpha]